MVLMSGMFIFNMSKSQVPTRECLNIVNLCVKVSNKNIECKFVSKILWAMNNGQNNRLVNDCNQT